MSKQSLTTYYAVSNVNGPISVSIEAATVAEAVEEFEAMNDRELIDDARTDAEDELDIDGEGMDESAFDAALEAAGCSVECELDDAARNRHVGGWWLWSAPSEESANATWEDIEPARCLGYLQGGGRFAPVAIWATSDGDRILRAEGCDGRIRRVSSGLLRRIIGELLTRERHALEMLERVFA